MANNEMQLRLASDPRLLAAVRGLVRSYVTEFGVEPSRIDNVVLAVDEACSNAIRHAYAGRTDGVMELTLRAEPGAVIVRVRDEGQAADPKRVARKRTGTPSRKRVKPGGLGMGLIYEVFDGVEFETGGPDRQGNCVTMRLNLPEESPPGT
ncbi:MAG: ATP-binding protein [bacterium]|nr:ATP-binding protein [bacterium]